MIAPVTITNLRLELEGSKEVLRCECEGLPLHHVFTNFPTRDECLEFALQGIQNTCRILKYFGKDYEVRKFNFRYEDQLKFRQIKNEPFPEWEAALKDFQMRHS